MDIPTFIVEITKTFIWPVVILVIAFNFKKEVSNLLLRINKVKHKDTQIEFTEKIEKLIEQNIEHGVVIGPPSKSNPLHKVYEMLIRLADISPRAAVLEAFRVLECAAVDAIPEENKIRNHNPIKIVSILRENNLLSEQDYFQFKQLKSLRNQAAHDEEFDLKGMPIEAYIDLALTIAQHIKQKMG
ncbi:hypothetical protein [Legionella bozemanae]|uniref:hypothetical protein n=1 Tax=Legionella bozemanae TaxID=447 RepID=UPI0010414CCF|nr:hypothetical protein [Legionella bozemanae]